ncbi:MAG: PAS domain S-box protein, partial [Hydrogenophaga sp.]
MDHNTDPAQASSDLEAVVAQRTRELQQALDRAQSLYDHAPCGYLSLDASLRFVNINQTLLNWLGYTREEVLLHRDLFDLIDPALRENIDLRLQSLQRGEQTDAMEVAVRCKDGSQIQVLCSSTGVFDASGQFMHSNTTMVDISERKAAERRLSAHESFLQTITDRIPVHLAYYDKDLVCRFVNRAHAHGNGKQPHEMIGEPLALVVPPDLLPDILPHVADALNGQPQTFEVERGEGDGRRHYEIHYIPDNQNGLVEGIFIELHDITDRKRTEEFVLEANRDLEERVHERSAELFLSEQRYRLMVDAIQDYCVYFVDEEGVITEWSESAQRLHGHRRQQIVGKAYRQLLALNNGGEDEVDPDQVLRLAKAHGQWETRGWRLRDDGSRFWAHTV